MKVAFIQFSYGTLLNGAGSVMGSLIRDGHEVKFYNIDHTNSGIIEFLKRYFIIRDIIQSDCVAVFMSCMTMELPTASKVARDIRLNIDIPVVIGGVHPTIMPEDTLRNNPRFDYICVGDGETFVSEFMRNLYSPDLLKIQNLGYRNGEKIIINPIREPEDLSKLPPIPYDLYPRNYIVDEHEIAYVRATRGCPYSCTFCCNQTIKDVYHGEKYLRKKPIDDVMSDINILLRYDPKMLVFSDEMFLTDKGYAHALFDRLSEIPTPFGFLARAEHVTEDIVTHAQECGCRYIAMGVECGDEAFRKNFLNRKMSNEQIAKAFDICCKNGIYTTSLNMIGYPVKEDPDSTKSTIVLNEQINPKWVQVSFMYPFPGTPIYDYCIKNNLIDPEKAKNTTTCFEDSVLKNVSLKETRDTICKKFNKNKFLEGVI